MFKNLSILFGYLTGVSLFVTINYQRKTIKWLIEANMRHQLQIMKLRSRISALESKLP